MWFQYQSKCQLLSTCTSNQLLFYLTHHINSFRYHYPINLHVYSPTTTITCTCGLINGLHAPFIKGRGVGTGEAVRQFAIAGAGQCAFKNTCIRARACTRWRPLRKKPSSYAPEGVLQGFPWSAHHQLLLHPVLPHIRLFN